MKKIITAVVMAALFFITGCSTGPSVEGAPENVKTYLIGSYEDSDSVQAKLKDVGFEVVAVAEVGKDKIQNIIFTNDYVKNIANKPTRGLLAGEMRIFVNKDRNELRVNNPLYFFKAYLQDEYKVGDEKPVVDALMKAFPSLTDSVMGVDSEGKEIDLNPDYRPYSDLAKYHYMIGMQYYHDQDVVGEAASTAELVAKLKKKAKKDLIYTIELAPNRIVVGVNVGTRTAKFPAKIGEEKASLLPWQILIEEKEVSGKIVAQARTLNGRYRIALGYPLLTMMGEGSFAGIMTIPGAILKDMEKFFK